jgi:transcriptional regulator with XRE-family HTH domain
MADEKRQTEERDPFLSELVSRRHARNLTTRELARLLDMSPAFVSLVETGQKTPSEEKAEEWASRLDMDPKIFRAWVRSRHRGDPQTMMLGEAEYRYFQSNPNVRVRLVPTDKVWFESANADQARRGRSGFARMAEPGEEALRVPLLPEGADPGSDPEPREYVTVQEELLQGERLVRPFAWRLSPQGVERVFKTLHAGDYAVISREARQLERDEIYAVKVRNRIVLSRVIENAPDLLLLLSDGGEAEIDALRAEEGKVRSLITGKVVAAIRPLQYSIVKPSGGRGER